LYRRYFGEPERSKVEAGPLRGTGRFIIGAELDQPTWQRARTLAWTVGVGDTLRLGTPLVPGADSIELKRVRPDAPYPATVVEVVTAPSEPSAGRAAFLQVSPPPSRRAPGRGRARRPAGSPWSRDPPSSSSNSSTSPTS